MRKANSKVYTNSLIRKITWIYGIVLVLMGLLASYMAYDKESAALATQLEQTMTELEYTYKSVAGDFWKTYMPISANAEGMFDDLRSYFTSDSEDLSPMEKDRLQISVRRLMAYSNGISWIGIYKDSGHDGYYLFSDDNVLRKMTQDFPFLEEIEEKGTAMEAYESRAIHNGRKSIRTFALCGNATTNLKDGKIIFGYDTDAVFSVLAQASKMDNVNYYVLNESGIIFDSSGAYDEQVVSLVQHSGNLIRQNGKLVRVYSLNNTNSKLRVFCTIPWQDAVLRGHTFSPYILAIVVLFLISSLLIYRWTGRNIMGKIHVIQTGLHKIGENELDYRIPVPKDPKDEFENIGRSINDMSARLQENIDKTYELKLKQKEAELSELQAKFDPHFLYNTLEVIRGKVYENGDIETSNVIIKMAQLFRNLIGSENFVTVRDELDYCNSYLSLMEYRYEDKVDIIFDIDSDVMHYGIIRNLLQPVLENFFVHGIDEDKWKHTLRIRGKIYDEEYIWFYVQDDGLGIPEEKLESLTRNLEDAASSAQSYGLRNVQRRIKLFYGPDCGLVMKNNELGGTTVEIKIKRLTLEGHESRLNEG